MKTYCLGFAFYLEDKIVALIRKNKPEWQRGLLNGVGGKIEDGETPEQAMVREFKEETDLAVPEDKWTRVTQMRFLDCVVYVFATRLPFNVVLGSPTDEQVMAIGVDSLPPKTIANLRWLIPMSIDKLNHRDVPNSLNYDYM